MTVCNVTCSCYIVVCVMSQSVISVTGYLGHFQVFCQKIQLLTCDVAICNIKRLYDVVVCDVCNYIFWPFGMFYSLKWQQFIWHWSLWHHRFVWCHGLCDIAVHVMLRSIISAIGFFGNLGVFSNKSSCWRDVAFCAIICFWRHGFMTS